MVGVVGVSPEQDRVQLPLLHALPLELCGSQEPAPAFVLSRRRAIIALGGGGLVAFGGYVKYS